MAITKTYKRCAAPPVVTTIAIAEKPDTSKDSSSHSVLVKGNHHSDLPYSASWVEYKVRISGEQSVNVRNEYATKECPTGYYTYVGSVPYSRIFGTPAAPPAVIVPKPKGELVSMLRDAAITSALAGARRSYMNNVQNFLERKETINLVVQKVKQLSSIATVRGRADLRRYFASPKHNRKAVAKQIANEHLGFLFGVLPLVGEIEGLMDYLSKVESKILTGRGKRAEISELGTQGSTSGFEAGLFGASGSYLTKQRVSVRCSLKYKVIMQNVLEAQQLGLNPIAVFYDLVPLSFLSDFLSNTGNFLRGLDPIPALEYSTGSWTLYCQSTVEGEVVPYRPPSAAKYSMWSNSGSASYLAEGGTMSRTVLPHEPSGTWMVQNNMSLAKAITAAALAVQRYVKPLRRIVGAKPFRYQGPRPKYLPPVNYMK